MRGDWRVTPAVASTTQFDMVHLVIGRPGVILVGEGNPSRVRALIGQEKRRLAKVIGNADLRDVIVGDGEGEVPMAKLRMTLMKHAPHDHRQRRQRAGDPAQGADRAAADAEGRDPEEHAPAGWRFPGSAGPLDRGGKITQPLGPC